MRVVYADAVFLLNFIIDYILLLITAKICGCGARRARLAAAAALGGLYALAAAIYPDGPLTAAPAVMAAGAGVSAAAFAGQTRGIRLTVVFFAVAAAFAGVVLALSLLTGGDGLYVNFDFKLLLITFTACYAVLSLVFRGAARAGGESYASLTVRLAGRELRARALIDTGNTLRDPITGCRVIVLGAGEAAPLFPHATARALARVRDRGAVAVMEELGKIEGGARFRLVPYSSVGVRGGMLPAFRPDEVLIDGVRAGDALIALSPNGVSDNGTYSALVAP
ncbi:MAG: sigma-E processing peptidase SpoIIGA [Oscillospiraceae bacterium]|jgi:stage II sporulation protein GA (sporulation sigma-E factor processing peptidase)|nr:sigma-E processing peptidase SpoIIGA [Oscillospiraceae bacterium]